MSLELRMRPMSRATRLWITPGSKEPRCRWSAFPRTVEDPGSRRLSRAHTGFGSLIESLDRQRGPSGLVPDDNTRVRFRAKHLCRPPDPARHEKLTSEMSPTQSRGDRSCFSLRRARSRSPNSRPRRPPRSSCLVVAAACVCSGAVLVLTVTGLPLRPLFSAGNTCRPSLPWRLLQLAEQERAAARGSLLEVVRSGRLAQHEADARSVMVGQ